MVLYTWTTEPKFRDALFTWCEIQGLFHDFPEPFQENLVPSLPTELKNCQ